MMKIRVKTMRLITSLLNSKTAFRSPAHPICSLASFMPHALDETPARILRHSIQSTESFGIFTKKRQELYDTPALAVQGLLTEWGPHVGCAAACAYECLRRTLFMISQTTVLMALIGFRVLYHNKRRSCALCLQMAQALFAQANRLASLTVAPTVLWYIQPATDPDPRPFSTERHTLPL